MWRRGMDVSILDILRCSELSLINARHVVDLHSVCLEQNASKSHHLGIRNANDLDSISGTNLSWALLNVYIR